ncbi:UbiA family prenyltransferase [Ulvibacter antarcticus]|uniref:4-hydroxybenzoate polyprenyltransferase n=1 Tax=Ulvibacter antarcticus TaxID=442714 RepID=A0A3L9Z0E5_9FLAO|nr:UbiA family prenyltransferase [Ulvibacter antarcticus]RMA66336.1 4-hydroxybenzoate polyprenyltransferase [Ulvibacter antarcticus]
MTDINRILQDLKISRPGLWFPTIWIYLVPFNFDDSFWTHTNFWIGFFFVTFPLNYLVYGLNDYNDIEADSVNERKGNFLFGAKASKVQLASVPLRIAVLILPFIVYFTIVGGWEMLLLLLFMIAINIAYNFEPFRFKEKPPFEICIQIGYVFTAFFSVLLNDLSMIPWQTIVYLSFFAFQAHIAGEIMDIEPDRLAGKRTTATLIGRKRTKFLMLFLLFIEVIILIVWFEDYVLSGFLAVFALWLLIDVFFIFKDAPYNLNQMKLFGIAMNVSAILSMIWILYSGKLMHPVY